MGFVVQLQLETKITILQEQITQFDIKYKAALADARGTFGRAVSWKWAVCVLWVGCGLYVGCMCAVGCELEVGCNTNCTTETMHGFWW